MEKARIAKNKKNKDLIVKFRAGTSFVKNYNDWEMYQYDSYAKQTHISQVIKLVRRR